MKRSLLILLSITIMCAFSCKKQSDNNYAETTEAVIEKITPEIETTVTDSATTLTEAPDPVLEYLSKLQETIYSDKVKSISNSIFHENGGAAGYLTYEFPGGTSESVSGATYVSITDDKALVEYGYTGFLFIGKTKDEVINELGIPFDETNDSISYNYNELIFKLNSNQVVTEINM